MTLKERAAGFEAAINAAEAEFGMRVVPTVETVKFGEFLIPRLALKLEVVRGWEEPEETKTKDGKGVGVGTPTEGSEAAPSQTQSDTESSKDAKENEEEKEEKQ